jgi:hypothetical protein
MMSVLRVLFVCSVLPVAGLFSSAGALAAGNLIRDGGFERPIVPDAGLTRFFTGERVSKWKVVGAAGAVDLINTNFTFAGFSFPSKGGVQWLDLTGNSQTATGVQQTISTTIGTTYAITFFIGSVYNPGGPVGDTSTVNVLVNGEQIARFTNTARPTDNKTQQWRKFTTEFVADTTSTRIGFINADPGSDTDNGIDNVTVAAVSP